MAVTKYGPVVEGFRHLRPRLTAGGTYYIVRKVNGRKQEISLGTKDLAEAKKAYEKEVGKDVARNRSVTVAAALDQFLVANSKRGSKTVDRQELALKGYMVKHIGSMPVASVKPQHIINVLATARAKTSKHTGKPLSENSIYQIFSSMRVFFRWCAEEPNCYCLTNPVVQIGEDARPLSPSAVSSKVTENKVVRADEVEKIADAFTGDETSIYKLATLVRLAPETGMRIGEMLALQVSDLKLLVRPYGIISVERTTGTIKTDDRSTWFDTLKGEKGRIGDSLRNVPLSEYAREVLDAYVERGFAEGWLEQGSLLFPSEQRTPLAANNVQRRFKKAVADAGIKRRVTFHHFRHTFISEKLEAGLSVEDISLITGNTPQMITRVYGHVQDQSGVYERIAASGRRASGGQKVGRSDS